MTALALTQAPRPLAELADRFANHGTLRDGEPVGSGSKTGDGVSVEGESDLGRCHTKAILPYRRVVSGRPPPPRKGAPPHDTIPRQRRAVVLALAAFGFYTSQASRPIFQAELADR